MNVHLARHSERLAGKIWQILRVNREFLQSCQPTFRNSLIGTRKLQLALGVPIHTSYAHTLHLCTPLHTSTPCTSVHPLDPCTRSSALDPCTSLPHARHGHVLSPQLESHDYSHGHVLWSCATAGVNCYPAIQLPHTWSSHLTVGATIYHRLLTTYYLLPTAYYLLPTTYYLLPTTYYLPPTTYHLPPTTYCLLPTAYYLLPTTYYLPPTTYLPTTYLPPTTYYLPHTTYHLPPTTYYLLPTTYYLPPISQLGIACRATSTAERQRDAGSTLRARAL